MKAILTAFGGKLKSEPMLWPEHQGITIRLYMDAEDGTFPKIINGNYIGEMVFERPKIVEFKVTGEFIDGCQEYRFTGNLG